jgi:hypothetical protein
MEDLMYVISAVKHAPQFLPASPIVVFFRICGAKQGGARRHPAMSRSVSPWAVGFSFDESPACIITNAIITMTVCWSVFTSSNRSTWRKRLVVIV